MLYVLTGTGQLNMEFNYLYFNSYFHNLPLGTCKGQWTKSVVGTLTSQRQDCSLNQLEN